LATISFHLFSIFILYTMHLGTLLTLPLLAAAVPAAPLGGQAPFQPSSYDPEISIDLDLDDLRLVRFAENEQPVYVYLYLPVRAQPLTADG
jgi:hypothetical protein